MQGFQIDLEVFYNLFVLFLRKKQFQRLHQHISIPLLIIQKEEVALDDIERL